MLSSISLIVLVLLLVLLLYFTDGIHRIRRYLNNNRDATPRKNVYTRPTPTAPRLSDSNELPTLKRPACPFSHDREVQKWTAHGGV